MADAQIAIIDGDPTQIAVIEGDQTQIVMAPGENPAIVTAIPGPQGPAGAGVPTGGAANEVLYKVSSTFGDTAWGPITSAMIGDLQIVNADVSASAAIAGTKISPNFGSQNVTTTGTSTAASFIPTSSTAPTNGLYLSAANSVALSTNGNGRLFVDADGRILAGTSSSSANTRLVVAGNGGSPTGPGNLGLLRGSANPSSGLGLGSLYFADSNGGVGADVSAISDGTWTAATSYPTRLVFSTTANGAFIPTERLRITSAGLVGIGSSAPYVFTQIEGQLMATGSADQFASEQKVLIFGRKGRSSLDRHNYISSVVNFTSGNDNKLLFYVDNSSGTSHVNPLTLTGANRVGIGTMSPGYLLDVRRSSAGDVVAFTGSTDGGRPLKFVSADNGIFLGAQWTRDIGSGSGIHAWAINGTERARIDSSGRLLVGTSSARTNLRAGVYGSVGQIETAGTNAFAFIQNAASEQPYRIVLAKQRSGSAGGNTIVNSGDNVGSVEFLANDGTNFIQAAKIETFVDGTPGANDMPGRIVLSTTADGAASPTERMRIKANGTINFSNVSVYADNAAATAGGLAVGDVYRTSTGQLMIRY